MRWRWSFDLLIPPHMDAPSGKPAEWMPFRKATLDERCLKYAQALEKWKMVLGAEQGRLAGTGQRAIHHGEAETSFAAGSTPAAPPGHWRRPQPWLPSRRFRFCLWRVFRRSWGHWCSLGDFQRIPFCGGGGELGLECPDPLGLCLQPIQEGRHDGRVTIRLWLRDWL